MQDHEKTQDQLIDELNELRSRSILRDDAEDNLGKSEDGLCQLNNNAPEGIIQELQVHQIELEIRNDELKTVQLELEASRDKGQDLYVFAPTV